MNQELRMRYMQASCLTIKNEGFMKQIRVSSDETLVAVFKWKEERGLDIKRIYFEEYDEKHGLYLPHLGTLFPHLQEIKLLDCTTKLKLILFASLTHWIIAIFM